jgi:3-dehydroquinate synthase
MAGHGTVRVRVAVPQHPYEAVIGNHLLERAGAQLRKVLDDREHLFVVTALPVRRRWGKKLMDSLAAAGFKAKFIEMPAGERHKKLATVEALAENLAKRDADRNGVVVAFGGGVVGDTAGLLASLYMRGVDLAHIPTTLLAQVDASIGGKTGVNLSSGKNLLGTFHQPRVVLIDPLVLSTLSDRQFRAGLYEALKYGVIGNRILFEYLEKTRVKTLRQNAAELQWVIAESVKLKAKVVAADEREGDLRRVLNFGHTIGHALEVESRYRRFLHGEAVAWGMIAAAYIAAALGKLDQNELDRISNAVLSFGSLPGVTARRESILRLLKRDKKTRNAVIHFVVPTRIGSVEVVRDVPPAIVLQAVDEMKRLSGRQGR